MSTTSLQKLIRKSIVHSPGGYSYGLFLYTSGEFGPTFIKTQAILGNVDDFKKHTGSAKSLMEYSIDTYKESQKKDGLFSRVVKYAAIQAELNFPIQELNLKRKKLGISGGMRRDILFSAPVFYVLSSKFPDVEFKHVAMGKDGSIAVFGESLKEEKYENLKYFHLVHVADLNQTGSSFYSFIDGKHSGWIPFGRSKGATMDYGVCIMSREGKSDSFLREKDKSGYDINFHIHSLAFEDSEYPHEAYKNGSFSMKETRDCIKFLDNKEEWRTNFIKEKPVETFIELFDNVLRVDERRVKRFLKKYRPLLENEGKYKALEKCLK